MLPDHSPGSGKGVVAEAQRSTSCNKISYIPFELGSSHWDAVLVGANEIMTPCVRTDFYGESVSVCVCFCVYMHANMLQMTPCVRRDFYGESISVYQCVFVCVCMQICRYAVLVSANEIMTPCVRTDFYGESVSFCVCFCVYMLANMLQMTPCVRRDFYGESISVHVCLCLCVYMYANMPFWSAQMRS